MKRAIILYSIVDEETRLEMYSRYKDCVPKEFANYLRKPEFWWVFEPESPALYEAMETLDKLGKSYTQTNVQHYTKKELLDVEFYHMEGSYPFELEGTSTKDYGTQYEKTCPWCNFGQDPIGDIYVDRKFTKNLKFAHVVPEIVVSPEVRQIIEGNNLTGVSFRSLLKDFKGRSIPPYHVIEIQNILPPLSETTWLEYESWRRCSHDVTFLRSDLQYERQKLDNAKDFNLTYECIDNYRIRQVVVSAKVKKLFNEHRIRVRFTPVTILDDSPTKDGGPL